MGDPRKVRRKYATPSHPWQKTRIDKEKQLRRDYAFKNKKEIWKMTSTLKGLQAQAKKLNAARSAQAEKETQQLLQRLVKMSLLSDNVSLDAVLDLQVENVLERRLQSLVYRRGLAHTMKQARQFITHGHIGINGIPVTSPSHLVTMDEEKVITFVEISALKDDMHPERLNPDQIKQQMAEKAAQASAEIKAQEAAEAKATEKPAEAAKAAEAPVEATEVKEAPGEAKPTAEKPTEAELEKPPESPEEAKE